LLLVFHLAVVVPDPEKLKSLASQLGVKGDAKKICEDERIINAIYKSMTDAAKQEKLKGFEVSQHI
jgi:long-subunit acyl-CoA synthetase (AMP-forming)